MTVVHVVFLLGFFWLSGDCLQSFTAVVSWRQGVADDRRLDQGSGERILILICLRRTSLILWDLLSHGSHCFSAPLFQQRAFSAKSGDSLPLPKVRNPVSSPSLTPIQPKTQTPQRSQTPQMPNQVHPRPTQSPQAPPSPLPSAIATNNPRRSTHDRRNVIYGQCASHVSSYTLCGGVGGGRMKEEGQSDEVGREEEDGVLADQSVRGGGGARELG